MTHGRYHIVIQPIAKAEVAEAAQWYESQERGLGREFLRAFRAGTAVLRRNPLQYQTVDEETRRLLLRRFPYSVFYEVHGSTVVVLACVHQARDPALWQQRVTRRPDPGE
ncbi:MAG: type II toxin-antitoxin system RelE/ParE family toxin [Longimicrobiaceae bacterium]